ncbi:hypothetical protein B0H11DRAFT_1924812 [Mycena galericulata]|nr:hypothetical protein B0H11DRAFT_1924812 [Mycena galericulata]
MSDAAPVPASPPRESPSPPPTPPRVSSDPPYYTRDWREQSRTINWPRYWGDAPEDQPTRLMRSNAQLPYWRLDQEEDDIVAFRAQLAPWTSGKSNRIERLETYRCMVTGALRDRHTPQNTWPETIAGNAERHIFRRTLIRSRLAELREYCPELEEMEARAVAQFEINQFFPLRPQDEDWGSAAAFAAQFREKSPGTDASEPPAKDPLFDSR